LGIRALIGDASSGVYKEPLTDWIQLYSNAGGLLFELRGAEHAQGPAKAGLANGRFLVSGTWRASRMDPPGVWHGLMLKGGGGAIVGGEGSVCCLVKGGNPSTGVELGTASGRLGVTVGGSAGFCFVIATGFANGSAFDGYTSDGGDWALSFGPKIKSVIAASRLPTALVRLAEMVQTLEEAAKVKALTRFVRDPENSREIYSVAKSVQASYLIDDEYQGIVALDIPLAGVGAEVGIYYQWSRCKVWLQW
jgi:hypothetical protein